MDAGEWNKVDAMVRPTCPQCKKERLLPGVNDGKVWLCCLRCGHSEMAPSEIRRQQHAAAKAAKER